MHISKSRLVVMLTFVLMGGLVTGVALGKVFGYNDGVKSATEGKVIMATPSDSFRYPVTFLKTEVPVHIFQDDKGASKYACGKLDPADNSYLLDTEGVRFAAFK